ncbi:MAG: hypothetical protein QXJ68_05500 [Methanocellales archaeon]
MMKKNNTREILNKAERFLKELKNFSPVKLFSSGFRAREIGWNLKEERMNLAL